MMCPAPEVFFGGARYGGKTDGVIGKWARKEAVYGPHFNAVMFRQTTTASEDAIRRSIEIYHPLGGKFNETKLRWKMPHGGQIRFSYLRTVADAAEFQGKNLSDGWTDEGGQYPNPDPIDRLFGALRSPHGVPVQLIITANPGGPGQTWIADRYKLIPLPHAPTTVVRMLPNGKKHIMAVIPSRITDNKIGLRGDPSYVDRLHLSGSKNLVRAWLEGDWNAVDGAYFDCWTSNMVIEPFSIPAHWTRFRSYDWGSAAPFSVGWWAIADGETGGIPAGSMVRYREWYGCQPDKPNKGIKITNKEQARGILEREAEGEASKMAYSTADPSIFAEDGGPSIAEQFSDEGVYFIPADNSRIAGWSQMRLRMTGSYGKPLIYCFSTCKHSIRTIPVLPHSDKAPEDLDTDAEDHLADDWRYACTSRPWVSNEVAAEVKPDRYARAAASKRGGKSWR